MALTWRRFDGSPRLDTISMNLQDNHMIIHYDRNYRPVRIDALRETCLPSLVGDYCSPYETPRKQRHSKISPSRESRGLSLLAQRLHIMQKVFLNIYLSSAGTPAAFYKNLSRFYFFKTFLSFGVKWIFRRYAPWGTAQQSSTGISRGAQQRTPLAKKFLARTDGLSLICLSLSL